MPDGLGVTAAGAVVTRSGGREVLLVHRPKYDDWSFPKGKRDPGEHVTTTAVREVHEESGLKIVLGRPLPPQLYAVAGGRAKTVHYWVARVRGNDDVTRYAVNAEIDDVRWVKLERATKMLSYLDDITLLEQFAELPRRTWAVTVVRHGRARGRKAWTRPDPLRPLTPAGRTQAEAIAPVLAAYRIGAVISSPSVRCVQTIQPYADHPHVRLSLDLGLSEEDADAGSLDRVAKEVLAARRSTAVCTHRPVLPELLARFGITEEPLAPGEMVICHHRKGQMVAVERHLVR
jgi:8-oxo-dGTP pyrophosphatase MutT (NUDIX family)/phosphohistidine phosphatase SixA